MNHVSAETYTRLVSGTGRNCMPEQMPLKRKTKTCSGNRLFIKDDGSVTRNFKQETCHGL